MRLGIVLSVCMALGGISDCCILTDFVDLKLMERFVQTDVVIFGRTMEHIFHKENINGVMQYIIDARVDVLCVLQNAERNVAENIIVKRISPRDDCTGTPISKVMKVGDYDILGLKQSGSAYELLELMPRTTAVVPALKPYLFSLSSLCPTQRWRAPTGATNNRCPICGIANFPTALTNLFDPSGDIRVCPKTGTTFAFDMDACDLWMDETVASANAATCIPDDFSDSCVMLLYRTPPANASCDCSKVDQVATGTKTSGTSALTASSSVFFIALTVVRIMY